MKILYLNSHAVYRYWLMADVVALYNKISNMKGEARDINIVRALSLADFNEILNGSKILQDYCLILIDECFEFIFNASGLETALKKIRTANETVPIVIMLCSFVDNMNQELVRRYNISLTIPEICYIFPDHDDNAGSILVNFKIYFK